MLRGMRGQIVDAAIFLPWDDGGFSIAQFSGTLREVEYQERLQPRWVLSWVENGEGTLHPPEVAIWERRFLRAELSFTGDAHKSFGDFGIRRGIRSEVISASAFALRSTRA